MPSVDRSSFLSKSGRAARRDRRRGLGTARRGEILAGRDRDLRYFATAVPFAPPAAPPAAPCSSIRPR